MPNLKKHLAVLVLALAIPVVFAAPAAAGDGHGFPNKCGDDHFENGYGWFNLKTYDTACSVAKKVADAYVFTAGGPEGWNCRQQQIADEVWKATCSRRKDGRHQHVRFKFGA